MPDENTKEKRRVGIMGGTFDPIHFGHLFIAECSLYKFGLEKVLFIPAGKPVHKKRKDILEPVHRLQMTRLAVQHNHFFEVSAIEIEREGPTYTVDTLNQLHSINKGADQYFYITGADAILEILTWKDVTRVFDLCSFIAVTRPGYSLEELNRVLKGLTEKQRNRISVFETTGILISSTEIRERVHCREPIRYLVPDAVEEYIREHQLYSPV